MLEIGNPSDNRVVTITAAGQLSKEDYDRLLPEMERLLDEYGSLRFYIKLEDLSGMDMAALWEDIKFDVKYGTQFEKIAVLGEKKLEEWATKLSKIFFEAEIKFFYHDDKDKAWRWINA